MGKSGGLSRTRGSWGKESLAKEMRLKGAMQVQKLHRFRVMGTMAMDMVQATVDGRGIVYGYVC